MDSQNAFDQAYYGSTDTQASSEGQSFDQAYYGADYQPQPAPTSQNGSVAYILHRAKDFGLDPNAVVGVSQNEGLSGGVGDNGTSFGPFQLHAGGALPDQVWQQGPQYAQKWAWSPEGIDYALQKMADSGAKGLTGRQAVEAIVLNFERPADPTGDLQSGYNYVGGNQ